MKIKSDFITNSSSSSFVIALRKFPEIDKETKEKYPHLKFYEKMVSEFLQGDNYETADDYLKYFGAKTVGDLDEEWELPRYRKVEKYLNEGYKVLQISVDYSEETRASLIQSLDDKENFIILEGE